MNFSIVVCTDELNGIGFKNISFSKKKITLLNKNTEITLNSIIQGILTDKVSEILLNSNFENHLVNFGEGKTGTVRLIFEDNELSKILKEKGIRPGNSLMLKKTNKKIYNVETDEGNFSLDKETAAKIIVQN